MQQAIPKTLNLAFQKPTAIPAYTRRVTSLATNAQTFSENQLANIILDTSTPGSFLDPTQSLIQFDLTITNTNPYVDYLNLSCCGMGSLIQEFRIICQGTPIEEILDYNTMFEMWMDIGGHQQEEFKMYLENPMRSAAIHPTLDVNFIKPPMVDREGVIMCPNAINMHGAPSRFQGYRTQGRYLCQAEPGNLANAPLSVTGVIILETQEVMQFLLSVVLQILGIIFIHGHQEITTGLDQLPQPIFELLPGPNVLITPLSLGQVQFDRFQRQLCMRKSKKMIL
jgi:hypothetical protein